VIEIQLELRVVVIHWHLLACDPPDPPAVSSA
jgi:hypothetical protein